MVQSAFRSFFSLVRRSEEDDQLFDVRNWDGLWAVLGVIAVRKCRRQWRLFHGAGRDVGREQKLAPATGDSGSGWEAVTRQPLPEEAAALGDLVEQMLGRLVLRDRPILETRLKGTVSRKSSPRRVGPSGRCTGCWRRLASTSWYRWRRPARTHRSKVLHRSRVISRSERPSGFPE